MSLIFSKNCILKGEIDLYCLACCVYLMSEDDAILHMQNSKHKQIIDSMGYFLTYEEDFIRKVNGIYFCEICNVTMSTSTKVKLHVTETAHISGRRIRALYRTARGDVVSPGGWRVSAGAWHGLVDDMCVVCGVEGVHLDTHTQNRDHLLNLIYATVTMGDGGDIYRKVDEFYQCLTCEKVISEQLLNEHLNSDEHKIMLLDCSEITLTDTEESNDSNMNEKDADIQENTNTDIEFNDISENSNSKPIVTEKEETKPKCVPNIPETFAKEHSLFKNDDDIVFCDVCKTQIDDLDTLKQHIDNHEYKNNENKMINLDDNKKIVVMYIEKLEFFRYIKSLQIVFAEGNAFFMINNSICIDVNSFMGINAVNEKIRCRICDIDLTEKTVPIHVYSQEHKYLYSNTFVISSLKDEFVRQINSDKFDCTYCLKVESNLEDMLDHLSTAEHKKCKAKYQTHFKEFSNLMAQGLIAYINMNNLTRLDSTILENAKVLI